MRSPDDPAMDAVQVRILGWYERHQRDLPWRQTRDPYCILVSEVMLQQTQVDRVIPYYRAFLERFPTVEALASAPTADVIRIWAGLGYNRRAVNLQRTAQVVVRDYGGKFPADVKSLRSLPGIGAYTAGALACFAFEQDVAFLDTNIRRVLTRLFHGVPERSSAATLADLAANLVPGGDGWRWNQALIEFGALQCTSRKPLCVICPLQEHCAAFPVAQDPSHRNGKATPKEGPFKGSNRFYRGKVLHSLREAPDNETGLPLTALGPVIRADYSADMEPWLERLVRDLQRDGLARVAEESPAYDTGEPVKLRVKLP